MLKKLILIAGSMVLPLILATCTTMSQPEHVLHQSAMPDKTIHRKTLKVLSLNLAHGRKDGINQLFLRESRIRSNLQDIAVILKREDADIVALQEADGASLWSGGFDHVAMLAKEAGYLNYVRTSHAVSMLFSYGTALLSRKPFLDVVHHTFKPSPPTMNKGFTLGQIAWRPEGRQGSPMLVDVVSVHLDFSRKSVREYQIREMGKLLSGRRHPAIILGDFNSDWFAEEQVVQALAASNGLHVFMPEARDLGTYRSSDRRLDWILISNDLEFVSHEVLTDVLSDHNAIIATIRVKGSR